MRSAIAVVPICALAMSLGGAGVQAQVHDHGAVEPIVIEVTMAEFSFSPAVLRIPADRPVKLVFVNNGVVEHEFMAGRNAVNGDFEVDLFANVDVEMGSEEATDHDDAGAAPHDHPAAAAAQDHPGMAAHDHSDMMGQDDHGTMVLAGPGLRSSMTFVLPGELRGEWEMACFIPGHYDGGMYGTVIVN